MPRPAPAESRGRPSRRPAAAMKFVPQPDRPLYRQVRDFIQEQIDSGVWGPGTMLPRERDLCLALRVSRITVRESMRLLAAEGTLRRVQGRGTFVSSGRLEQRLNKFFSFSRWAEQNGIRAESRLLRVETTACSSSVARRLAIRPGDRVTRIERLRLGNGEPLSVEEIWVAVSLCPDLHLKDLARIPLNEVLERDYGIPPVRAIETIEPQAPDRRVAKLLRMQEGGLCLRVEFTAYAQDSRIVYYNAELCRGDRMKFSVELTRG